MDWILLVLVVTFAIRGLLEGFISQLFAVLGLLAGLWVAGWVSQWVGSEWRGARPALAFTVLRTAVVMAAGLAVATLVRWWGELTRDAFKSTPIVWLDRLAGFAIGGVIGAVIAVFLVLGLLLAPLPRALSDSLGRSRVARPAMARAAQTCSFTAHFFPGSGWLGKRFLAAERRAERRVRAS